MAADKHRVGLVVDRTLGGRIVALAHAFHVWVVESPVNTPVIDQYWTSEHTDPRVDPLASGITSFVADAGESDEEICARVAEDIDDHHGEFAHTPPWSEIEVFGVGPSTRLREVFASLGATTFESTAHGFVCRR